MKKPVFIFNLIVTFIISIQVKAAPTNTVIGSDILTAKEIQTTSKSKKGLVVVFLSAVCPCSDSHLVELKALAKDHPEFSFVGVHSNVDEPMEKSKAYFKNADLPFAVIQDQEAQLANQFKALKTPHVFVVLPSGETAYQGGVSSSRKFSADNKMFLREALEDIQHDQKVRTPEGRTLGCVISRGEKFVW